LARRPWKAGTKSSICASQRGSDDPVMYMSLPLSATISP
jgi:hypothetical protein